MQGLNPFQGQDGASRRYAPNRPIGARPQPVAATSSARRMPGPSRLVYRWNRLLMRPLYRRLIRVGLPAFVAALVVGVWLSSPDRRAGLTGSIDDMVQRFQMRDEFMVRSMTISGASPAIETGLREMLPVTLPASSFDIDLIELRKRIGGLDAVEAVDLRIKPGGVLDAVVRERVPALLWRHEGGIELLDKTGHRVASVTSRDLRRDLPLVTGIGAQDAAPEALALIGVLGPILPRVRGLERVGERRWDVVLDRGQRVMLPADNAIVALEQVMADAGASDLLNRDVPVIDMRAPGREVLRLGLTAQNTLRRARGELLLDEAGRPIVVDDTATKAGVTAPAKGKAAPKAAKPTSKKNTG